jgi:hypothetical protein
MRLPGTGLVQRNLTARPISVDKGGEQYGREEGEEEGREEVLQEEEVTLASKH